MIFRRFALNVTAVSATSLLLATAAPAAAQVFNAGLFHNLTNTQTGPTTVTPGDPFFNAQTFFTSLGDYSSATLTLPGGAIQNLPLNPDGLGFAIGPSFPSKAQMDSAYPMGLYTITLAAGTQPGAAYTINYDADHYASATPSLTAASFTTLQNLSTSAAPFNVTFNSFTPDPAASNAYTFFTIFGSNQGCGFLSPSAASCQIDPHQLARNTTYGWELDFSTRFETTTPDGVLTYSNFDVRTDGSFTTAAPEPSTWAMLLIGFAGLGFAARRKALQRA